MRLMTLKRLFMATIIFLTAFVQAGSLYVANHSFESPVVPPEADPPVLTTVTDWIEVDKDTLYGSNTGVFLNVTDINNVDANQLALLGGQLGNAFLQELSAIYQVGKCYRMTIGVCLPENPYYRPSDPNALALSFYYGDPLEDPNNYFVNAWQPHADLGIMDLKDFSVYVPAVKSTDPWAEQPIGIAIRATGPMGGYWDLDNVRVAEYPLVPNFTDDSIVNFADFAMMAADWQFCDDPLTDVTGDGCVDEDDLLIFMEQWLDNV